MRTRKKKEGKDSSYFGLCISWVSQTKIIRPPNYSIRNRDLRNQAIDFCKYSCLANTKKTSNRFFAWSFFLPEEGGEKKVSYFKWHAGERIGFWPVWKLPVPCYLTVDLAGSSIFWLECAGIFVLWNSLTGASQVLLGMLMYGSVLSSFLN